MPRRRRLSASRLLDLLGEGEKLKEVARDFDVDPTTIRSQLMSERRRFGARTNYQLLAIHLKKKLGAA